MPEISFKKVLFPEPLWPINATRSPWVKVTFKFDKASTFVWLFLIFRLPPVKGTFILFASSFVNFLLLEKTGINKDTPSSSITGLEFDDFENKIIDWIVFFTSIRLDIFSELTWLINSAATENASPKAKDW